MPDKYIAFIPKDWQFAPPQEAVDRLVATLAERGVVQGDPARPETLANGEGYEQLWKDPDPKPAPEGEGQGCDPGRMKVRVDTGGLRGYAGDNLTPVACDHCESELPYDQCCDSFFALAEGEGPDSDRLKIECFHCGELTPAVGADFGQSAGFSHFALVFEGETSNRVEPDPEGMKLLEEVLGTPMHFIQIHGW